jgi:hypothetical protein
MNRKLTLATVSFQTNPLTVIQEIMQRRVQLIDEIAKLGLVGLWNNSLLDVLSLGGFYAAVRASLQIVNVWRSVAGRRRTCGIARGLCFETEKERIRIVRKWKRTTLHSRGADLAFGWIPVNDAWACVDEARIPEPSRP